MNQRDTSELGIWERKYDRRGFVAVSALGALLAACSGGATGEETSEPTNRDPARPIAKSELEDTLVYSNWADYANPATYRRFEREFGVNVKRDSYASNEDLLEKVARRPRGFDLVVPTGYMVAIMADKKLLREIDRSKLPNVEKNQGEKFRGLPYDPDDRWSVAKDWGTTGFTYQTDLVKESPKTWRDFFDLAKGRYSRRVTLLDGMLEVTGSTAVMLGYSYNTDDERELDRVRRELLELKPHVLAVTSTRVRQLLASGKAVMGMTWNGDGVAVAAKSPAEYVVAKEGGELWVDAYAVPAGSKHPNAAHAWIDFTYRPEINALETSYHYYGSPLERELFEGVLAKEVLSNDDVFPPRDVVERLEANAVSHDGVELRERIWTEFRAA